jgi:hypothetical protein
MEIIAPVGTYIIPIGRHGTTWHSLDEVVLPARTKVVILEFVLSGEHPKMVVEVIPAKPITF